MGAFGETLFGGSRFIRWALSPFVLLFALVMPLLIEEWTLTRVAVVGAVEVGCLALVAGLWLPGRAGRGALRLAAALVFLAYAAYVTDEFLLTDPRFGLPRHQTGAEPWNALLGFLVIGLPSLWYALRGSFTERSEVSVEEIEEDRRSYLERMTQHDWAFYERHLQRPVPRALRELFADPALVPAGGLKYPGGCRINTFELLNENGLIETCALVRSEVVAIATTDVGDPIYLRPGPAEPDTVYITHHDGGDTEVFAESVAAMVKNLRQANYGSRASG